MKNMTLVGSKFAAKPPDTSCGGDARQQLLSRARFWPAEVMGSRRATLALMWRSTVRAGSVDLALHRLLGLGEERRPRLLQLLIAEAVQARALHGHAEIGQHGRPCLGLARGVERVVRSARVPLPQDALHVGERHVPRRQLAAHAPVEHPGSRVIHGVPPPLAHGQRGARARAPRAPSRRWPASARDRWRRWRASRFVALMPTSSGAGRADGRRGGELLLDAVGDHGGVDLTHCDDRHVARRVPARVVVGEVLPVHRLDGRLRPDGQAAAQGRLGGQPLVDVVADPLLDPGPRAPFLQDDLPLVVDLLVRQGQPVATSARNSMALSMVSGLVSGSASW